MEPLKKCHLHRCSPAALPAAYYEVHLSHASASALHLTLFESFHERNDFLEGSNVDPH